MLGSSDPKGRMVRNMRDKLDCVKIGRRLLFTEASVNAFILTQLEKQKRIPKDPQET